MKLKNIEFKCENKAGESLVFISKISVSNGGVFSFSFPDKIEDYARSFIKSIDSYDHKKESIYIDQPNKKNLYLYHTNFDKGRALLQDICSGYLTCEITEQNVIVYGYQNNVTYAKDKIGKMGPNGHFVNKDYDWHGLLDATHSAGLYSVGLYARVYKKVTHKRLLFIKHKYECFDHETCHDVPDSYADKLNCFIGMFLYDPDSWEQVSFKEMPYTEKAAEFFYNMLMSMCQIADKFEEFFGNEQHIIDAINTKQMLLKS